MKRWHAADADKSCPSNLSLTPSSTLILQFQYERDCTETVRNPQLSIRDGDFYTSRWDEVGATETKGRSGRSAGGSDKSARAGQTSWVRIK